MVYFERFLCNLKISLVDFFKAFFKKKWLCLENREKELLD